MRRFSLLLASALAFPLSANAQPEAPKAPAQHPAPKPQPKPDPHKAIAKPPQKKPPHDPGKGGKKPDPKASKVAPDETARRTIAGGPTAEDAQRGAETPELAALRAIEKELFPPAAPKPGTPWPSDTPFPMPLDPDRPSVHASGLPPTRDAKELLPGMTEKEPELAWIQSLKTPDIPVRWDARVVRYLQFFRDDPRGRSMAAYGWRKSGRWGEIIKKALRAEKVPESLVWLAMVESGFEPTARSHAGAAGLFQFMPDGARIYGLRVDRWVDERLDPVLASGAAARYLSDLQRRFGSWELALAAYNMGYGGLLAAIRKYNTNDYWELSKHEAGLPWETTLYVPKIIAFAVVAENPSVFGLESAEREQPIAFESEPVPAGISIDALAKAAGAGTKDVEALNPQLRAKRTPPAANDASFAVRLPPGRSVPASRLADLAAREPKLDRYTVKFGQTIDALAQELGTTRTKLHELNGMSRDELPRAGETLLVPHDDRAGARLGNERPVVFTPSSPSSIPGKTRVFYRVIPGDTLRAIADAFAVGPDDLRSWNAIDPGARLQEGMTLQVFVEPSRDLSNVVVLRESEATVLPVGSDAFFAYSEAQKGRRRVAVCVGPSDTWKSVAAKYGCTVGTLERINRRPRSEPLRPNETIIVYTGKSGNEAAPERRDVDPLADPAAPHPEDLPAIPATTIPATTISPASAKTTVDGK